MGSDALLTVSSGYASEVSSDDYMGCGLRNVIQSKGIRWLLLVLPGRDAAINSH